jgi:hypothetical protein
VLCIQVTADNEVNFGGVLLATTDSESVKLRNCGTADLVVDTVEIVPSSTSTEFALDFSDTKKAYPAIDAAKGPSKLAPLIIPASKHAIFAVKYKPEDITPDGKFDTAVIGVASTAKPQQLLAKGAGVKTACPKPKVAVKEGEQVVPQTTTHLQGSDSTAPGGGKINPHYSRLLLLQARLPRASRLSSSLLAAAHSHDVNFTASPRCAAPGASAIRFGNRAFATKSRE